VDLISAQRENSFVVKRQQSLSKINPSGGHRGRTKKEIGHGFCVAEGAVSTSQAFTNTRGLQAVKAENLGATRKNGVQKPKPISNKEK
jgi:hypothetical protein